MNPSPPRGRSLWIKVLVVTALLGVILVGAVGRFAMRNVRRPSFGPPEAFPEEGFTRFSARNADGNEIQAWYASGTASAGTVLLCHGHGVDHTNMASMTLFLRGAGLSLLLLDFRAHGASGGEYSSIGLHEWDDLRCVLEEAQARGFLATGTALAAFGRSMGAATLINGAGHLPQIRAFILESSFADLRLIGGRDFTRLTGIPDTVLTDLGFHLISWWTGIPFLANKPVEAIGGIGSRPALLIHDQLDPRATRPDHDRLKAALPHAAELLVPGAGHVQAYRVASTAFETAVLDLLATAGVLVR